MVLTAENEDGEDESHPFVSLKLGATEQVGP